MAIDPNAVNNPAKAKINPLLGNVEGSPVFGDTMVPTEGGPLEDDGEPSTGPWDNWEDDGSSSGGDPFTIGGVVPATDTQETPDEDALIHWDDSFKESDVDRVNQEEDIEFGPDTGEDSGLPLEGKPAQTRAARFQFALGSDASHEELINAIRTGTEKQLRERIATVEDLKDRQAKFDLIREKASSGKPITPEDVAIMAGISSFQPFNDPATIIERKYAQNYVGTLFGLNTNSNSVMQQAFRENPEGLSRQMGVAEEVTARQEVIKTILEEISETYEKQGWGGWFVDQAKMIFPLYSAAKLKLSTSGTESLRKGEIIADLISKYWSLPLPKMAEGMRKELMNLTKDNPSLAREVALATLHYTTQDKNLENFFTVLDAATFPGVGMATRGVGKGVQVVAGTTKEVVEGTIGAPKAVVGSIPNKPLENSVNEALKAGIKANATPEVRPAQVLNDVGDVEKSSTITNIESVKRAIGELNGISPKIDKVFESIKARVPSLANPSRMVEGQPTNLARARVEVFSQNLARLTDNFVTKMADEVKIGRTPDQALMVMVKEAYESIVRHRANHLNDLVLDVSWTRPDETIVNAGSVVVHLGDRSLKPFDTMQDALRVAEHDYGFLKGTYGAEQNGIGGWTIKLTQPLDETLPAVRQSINLGGNRQEPSMASTLLGAIRSGDDRVSAFQRGNRLATIHGKSDMDRIVKDFVKEVGRMNNKATRELEAVMRVDKMEINQTLSVKHGQEIRGVFRENVGDFEQAFKTEHGKYPTEQQIKAYFVMKRLHEVDYIIRNMNAYRSMSRLGWQEVIIKDTGLNNEGLAVNFTDRFHAKILDRLPMDSAHDGGVVIHTAGQSPRTFRLQEIKSNPALRTEVEELQAQGYKVVHNVNPVRSPLNGRLSNNDVVFVLTKNVEIHPLREVQIPFRPGWHSNYPQTDFVKQARVLESGGEAMSVSPDGQALKTAPKINKYVEDLTLYGFHSSGPAKKYAKVMEEARQALVRNDIKALENIKELPMSVKEFIKAFKPDGDNPPRYNLNSPFAHVRDGEFVGKVHEGLMRQSFPNFENLIDSPFNEMKLIDKKFMGQRSGPLQTVVERFDDAGVPSHTLGLADEFDPLQSMKQTVANITRSRYFDDYKTSHTEAWVQQFGHLLNVTKEDLAANPSYYLHNAESFISRTTDFAEARLAMDSRKALLELIGTPDTLGQGLDHLRSQMLNQVYEKKGMEAMNNTARKYIRKEDQEASGLLRSIAFHPNIGMFNPYQLFQNTMTTVNAIAIAGPVNGFKGAASVLPMRWAAYNENVLEKMAQFSTAYGWKPEWFKEAFQELKRSGRLSIEGEHTWKNSVDSPSVINTKWGDFLDAGLTFFKEGERATRIASHSMAYLEWRSANPRALLTDTTRREILARGDLMAGNMTRASNASYQYGLTSVPAQFTSYFTRLAEQMTGKRLTAAEKARVIGLNSAVYGVPIGVLGASGLGSITGGQFPFAETLRQEMYKRGVEMSDPAVDAFMTGVLGVTARAVTGVPTDLSGKVGPSGGQILKDLLYSDKSVIESFFGASGSTVGSLWRSLDPGMKWAMSMFRSGDNTTFNLRPEDGANILRNIKSADHVINIYWAVKYQQYFSKTGQLDTSATQEFSPTQAVFRALTGGVPADMTDRVILQGVNIDRQKLVKETIKKTAPDVAAALKAASEGDYDLAETYRQRVMYIFTLGDFTPQEMGQAWGAASNLYRSRIDKVRQDFYTKGPASKREKMFETFQNEMQNRGETK